MIAQRLTLACLAAAIAWSEAAPASTPCPIIPTPKEYRELGRVIPLEATAAIVVGVKATEPERYAAECLQTQIERRFQRKLPVYDEQSVPESVAQLFLLGQVETNARLKKLCDGEKIELGPESPGPDGFVIRCVDDGPRQVVLIGGSNPRGVIYGQNALFDLMRRDGRQVVFPAVTIRDWPSIAWRGRPHSVLKQHLVPGALDAYLRARMNFTDVRDDPEVKPTIVFPARKASMGFPAGRPIDRPLVSRMIRESHRRGLFVYGTVSCGVKRSQIGDVLKTFRELIELGVDGLWISFDDVGSGDDAPAVIDAVLALGREHGMTGRKIAITPPLKEYQTIDMPFNHEAATDWGLADVQWLFTRPPCKTDAETARRIGIRGLPGWWHNLVGIRGGFLHNGGVVCPLRKDGRPGYLNMQPLSEGWHHPTYEQLADGAKNTDFVLLWGVCGGWPEEYEVGVLGLWAWDPAGHDWQRTRAAVYRQVYGPALEPTAREFDDKLSSLKDLFELPPWRFQPNKGWPCRLTRLEDRPKALALIDELERLRSELQQRASSETAIDPARLQSVYLEPMEATLVYARKMATLDYPETTCADLEQTVLGLIDAGRVDEAEKYLESKRGQVKQQLAVITEALGELKGIDDYVAYWQRQVGNIRWWKEYAVQRKAKMNSRFQRLMSREVATLFPYKEKVDANELDKLFAAIDAPPAGKPLVEIAPGDWFRNQPQWSGMFCMGPFERKGRALAAIVYPRYIPSRPGEAGELSVDVPVPSFRGRLMLDAFVNDTRLDNHYRDYRFVQLWAGDRLLWEEDVAPDRAGREWVSIDVTDVCRGAKTVTLRFRVVDKRPVSDHISVAFCGPVRLREVDDAKPAAAASMPRNRMSDLPRIAYRSFWPQERYNRQFAEAGVKLVFIYPSNTICSLNVPYSNYPLIWTGPNQYNWKSLDDHIGDVLRWNPDARLMVMIDLNTPAWWVRSHGGEKDFLRQAEENPDAAGLPPRCAGCGDADSFCCLAEVLLRDDYRRDATEYMRKFLRHTESHYRDKIVAYQLSAGGTCEWYDWQKGKPGPLKQAAFAKWMGRPGLKVPEDRETTSHEFFYDPVKDADKIAYWKFHNGLIADAMLDFAAEARRVVDDRVPLGTFHGYIMELGAHRLLFEGQLAYDRTFQSPLLDYNTEPADYANRRGGGTGGFLYCIDSLLANGKGAWHEVDHTTYCLQGSTQVATLRRTGNGKRFDLQSRSEAIGALRREFAMAMIHGSHLWWFDMFGGWFDDPAIMAEMKKMTAISERFAGTGPGKAEVAVLADADSMYYVNGHSRLADSVLRNLQFSMFASGIPWRCYSFADLPRLDTSPFKVVILPNLFVVTPEKRKLLEEKLFRDGKTIVTTFAPGIITDGKYDPANIELLTGVKVDELGQLDQPQEAVYRDRGRWTSVFLRRPEMPRTLLQEMFRTAGVHVYCDAGDPFYANDELIALHSGQGGRRTIRLPGPRIVTELFEDRKVSDRPVSEFTETFQPMQTRLYWVARPAQKPANNVPGE